MQNVPASKSIRRNRVRNIDTDRLVRRRDFLIPSVTTNAGTRMFESRHDWLMRVAELVIIERALVERNILARSDTATKI